MHGRLCKRRLPVFASCAVRLAFSDAIQPPLFGDFILCVSPFSSSSLLLFFLAVAQACRLCLCAIAFIFFSNNVPFPACSRFSPSLFPSPPHFCALSLLKRKGLEKLCPPLPLLIFFEVSVPLSRGRLSPAAGATFMTATPHSTRCSSSRASRANTSYFDDGQCHRLYFSSSRNRFE